MSINLVIQFFFIDIHFVLEKNTFQNSRLRILAMTGGNFVYAVHIHSNLRVAQYRRFITKPVYLRGDTMVPIGGKILNFKISENLNKELSRTFYCPK